MGTILDSTKELSKKLGVEAEEQTIKDQIDAINASIDENFGGSVDIAEAVRTYSENAGGGGGGVSYPYRGIRVPSSMASSEDAQRYGMNICNPIDGDGNYKVQGSPGGTYALQPLKSCTFEYFTGISCPIYFTPTDDFDGFYFTANPETGEIVKLTVDDSRAAIVPGDEHLYEAIVNTTTVTVNSKSSNTVIIK